MNSFNRKNWLFENIQWCVWRCSKNSLADSTKAHSFLLEQAWNEGAAQPSVQPRHWCLDEGLRCYFREVHRQVLHVQVRSLRVKMEALSCPAHAPAAANVQPHRLQLLGTFHLDGYPVLQSMLLHLPCSRGQFVVFVCVAVRLLPSCDHGLNTHCPTAELLGQSNPKLPSGAVLTHSPCLQSDAQGIPQHNFLAYSVATKTHQIFSKPRSLLSALLHQSKIFNKPHYEITRRIACFQACCRLPASKE